MFLVLGVNPTLEMGGRIAAIIICLFVFVFIIVSVALNFVMAWGLSLLREKVNVVQKVRPQVENVNQATTRAKQGLPPDENENTLARTVAKVPAGVQKVDTKTVQLADKAAKGLIEARARTVQAQTILKAFFLPGLMRREALAQKEARVDAAGLEFKSPGYRMLMEEQAPEVPIEASSGEGTRQRMEAQQLRNVTTR
ncbi:hypothetical protein [Ktedonobacter racemifer]|uniref:Uncharacterized protein n=1 Tax=Ktedonobacter racemifer DSM 44963 TaxID=485913 RepID=D6TMD5_KTERA|nr:hypothetical protein [Ktedonobacter racemifer]EFH86935.1 hypothetical protein Krac_8253 [Ktedonobacter racemifer DSM 44963]